MLVAGMRWHTQFLSGSISSSSSYVSPMNPLGQTWKNVQSNSWHAIGDAVAKVFTFVCIGYYAMIICIFQLFWITKIVEIYMPKWIIFPFIQTGKFGKPMRAIFWSPSSSPSPSFWQPSHLWLCHLYSGFDLIARPFPSASLILWKSEEYNWKLRLWWSYCD